MNPAHTHIQFGRLRREVAAHGYEVDPRRVAEAIIVRLVSEAPLGPSGQGGPSPAGDAATRLRRAA